MIVALSAGIRTLICCGEEAELKDKDFHLLVYPSPMVMRSGS